MVSEWIFILKLMLAALLGGIVGFEREKTRRPAGLRTHMVVCVAACLITLVSIYTSGSSDPLRMAANIVTGIGFLGAGTIIASGGHVIGLTTAATIFAVAGIGIAIAADFYISAIFTTILIFGILELRKVEHFSHYR